MRLKIDKTKTEMPKPIPWVEAICIHAAAKLGRMLIGPKGVDNRKPLR